MRKPLFVVLAIVLGAAACGSTPTTGSSPDGPTPNQPVNPSKGVERARPDSGAPIVELASGFNNAGFELLQQQPANNNLILSPVSVGHAMLMMRGAADDPTGQAIDEGFGLPAGFEAHQAWNAIDQTIDSSNGTQLSQVGEPTPIVTIADRIWPRQNLQLDPSWVDLLASHHGSDLVPIDVGEAEVSRQHINSWVSEQTNTLIPELLPDGFIDRSTLLVLTDAVYFKAEWKLPFHKYGTTNGSFSNHNGSTTSVQFMRELEQWAPRAKVDGWAAAEVPYLGDDYSMLVIVPDDFATMRSDLSQALLDEIDNTTESGPYELLLPQWETETAIDLTPWLSDMGAAPGAYPAIEGGFIDAAVHAAVIRVDAVGTEAAAATAIGVEESGPPEPEFTIAADKPFFYVIRHVASGMVLFVGQVTDL